MYALIVNADTIVVSLVLTIALISLVGCIAWFVSDLTATNRTERAAHNRYNDSDNRYYGP